jgi:hypothetical protein
MTVLPLKGHGMRQQTNWQRRISPGPDTSFWSCEPLVPGCSELESVDELQIHAHRLTCRRAGRAGVSISYQLALCYR